MQLCLSIYLLSYILTLHVIKWSRTLTRPCRVTGLWSWIGMYGRCNWDFTSIVSWVWFSGCYTKFLSKCHQTLRSRDWVNPKLVVGLKAKWNPHVLKIDCIALTLSLTTDRQPCFCSHTGWKADVRRNLFLVRVIKRVLLFNV